MFVLFPRFRLRISVFTLPVMLLMLWTEGNAPFLIILLSALLHEIGHIVAMRALGYRVRRIDVLPMGALIVVPDGIPDRDEVIIALCGPLASLFCATVTAVLFGIYGGAILLFACVMNVILCLFNLLPIKKSDGGKALCCYLAYKNKKSAELVCSVASGVALALFLCFSVSCVIISDGNFGVLLLSIALIMQL